MFSFHWPWMGVLIVLPILVRLFWTRPSEDKALEAPRETLLHGNLDMLKESFETRRPRSSISSRLHAALLALLWVCLTLALMRPQWLEPYTESRTEGYDLMLALDTSRSMTAEDFTSNQQPISRMAVLKGTMDKFIAEREGDRIGLIVFGDHAFVLSPLTYDRDAVRFQLDDIEPSMAGDGTAIGDGLGLAIKKLRERPPGSRVLILITDGKPDGGLIPPLEAARLAAREGIRIYTIGVGSTKERVRLRTSDYRGYEFATDLTIDEELLQRIADIAQGAYFRATDTNALDAIYSRIDQLEKTRAESRTVLIPHPLFHWPLALALVLFLLLGLFPGAQNRQLIRADHG